MSTNKTKFQTYKGKPLVRSGDTIYYGDMRDLYVVKLDIKTKKKFHDLEIAGKVAIQLLSTDPLKTGKAILKTSEKDGLYYAMDIAEVWLERALEEG